MPFQRQVLFVALTALLFFTTAIHAETVKLADCPTEPEVVGKFYNDGRNCVRDRQVMERIIEPGQCPPGYSYSRGYCRKRLHRKVKPKCPDGYDYYGGRKNECHSPCPVGYSKSYGECILRRLSLPPRYMTCPETDEFGNVQHRYKSYCCSHELNNCPKLECNVENAPGKFYYHDGVCRRQSQSIARVTTPQIKVPRVGNYTSGPLPRRCPEGKIPVRSLCQEPCPEGFQTLKGKCELRACTFDTRTDDAVRCPEGVYKVPQAIV
mmetsp:Transcript_3324/g.6048  ORF Transcript_3324/g.6048 Transcript_3324/m.6048 type:complete len:265 (-) Transcript_3324:410-1204(-)